LIFRPKYSWKIWAAFVFFGPGIVLLAPEVWANPNADPMLSFSIVMIAAMLVGLSFVLMRKISFQENAFIVKYYLRSQKTIPYKDVVDIGNTTIMTRSGNLGLVALKNADELVELLFSQISEDQLSGETLENEAYTQVALVIGIILGPILYFLLSWLGVPDKWLELLTLAAWIIAFNIVAVLVKKYYQSKYA